MLASRLDTRSRGYRIGLWLILLGSATVVFWLFFRKFVWSPDPRITLEGMVYGTAYRPFVSRVLLPLIIRLIAALAPLDLEFLATGLMYLSLVGFVFAFRHLTTAFWRPSVLTDLASWAAIVGLLPFVVTRGTNLYDLSNLFLFTLGLALLARASWPAFLVVFPLACLNKETSLWLTLVYILHFYRRLDRVTFARLLLAQMAVYGLIRFALVWTFRNNPGVVVEFHLPDHFAEALAHPIRAALYLVAGLAVIPLALYRWRDKPEFLRHATLVTAPILFVLFWLFGSPFEIRVFAEAYPGVFLLSAQTLTYVFGVKLEMAG